MSPKKKRAKIRYLFTSKYYYEHISGKHLPLQANLTQSRLQNWTCKKTLITR